MKLTRYIVIRNGTETRLTVNRPRLEANEVAISVTINVPQPPRFIGNVEITLPEPPPTLVESSVEPYPDDGEPA